MTTQTVHTIDVRQIPPRDRHPTIFSTFRCLTSGQSMQLINDHDPVPLYHQLAAEQPGGFVWEYLEAGPDQWRVAITRTAKPAARSDGQCCGSCGGGH